MIKFELFDDIQHKPLQVYNRATMLINLMQDRGADMARVYAEQFTDVERKEIFLMTSAISTLGIKNVQEQVTKGLVFEDVV